MKEFFGKLCSFLVVLGQMASLAIEMAWRSARTKIFFVLCALALIVLIYW